MGGGLNLVIFNTCKHLCFSGSKRVHRPYGPHHASHTHLEPSTYGHMIYIPHMPGTHLEPLTHGHMIYILHILGTCRRLQTYMAETSKTCQGLQTEVWHETHLETVRCI